jgi:hypothetical protein
VDLGRIGVVLPGQREQRVELVGNIGQGDRLELAAPPIASS